MSGKEKILKAYEELLHDRICDGYGIQLNKFLDEIDGRIVQRTTASFIEDYLYIEANGGYTIILKEIIMNDRLRMYKLVGIYDSGR